VIVIAFVFIIIGCDSGNGKTDPKCTCPNGTVHTDKPCSCDALGYDCNCIYEPILCICDTKSHLGINEYCCEGIDCVCELKIYGFITDNKGNIINIYRRGDVTDEQMEITVNDTINAYNNLTDGEKILFPNKIDEIHIAPNSMAAPYIYRMENGRKILGFEIGRTVVSTRTLLGRIASGDVELAYHWIYWNGDVYKIKIYGFITDNDGNVINFYRRGDVTDDQMEIAVTTIINGYNELTGDDKLFFDKIDEIHIRPVFEAGTIIDPMYRMENGIKILVLPYNYSQSSSRVLLSRIADGQTELIYDWEHW
jgi:hypothetical protein